MAMAIKATGTTATDSETSVTLDLGLEVLPPRRRREVAREVGDFLIESVLDTVAEGSSPVSGERFPALSREYKRKKVEEGAPPIPNLDLHGDLWDGFDYRETDGGIKIGFFGDQAPKADGHLKFSGKEGTAPKRRALPAEG